MLSSRSYLQTYELRMAVLAGSHIDSKVDNAFSCRLLTWLHAASSFIYCQAISNLSFTVSSTPYFFPTRPKHLETDDNNKNTNNALLPIQELLVSQP